MKKYSGIILSALAAIVFAANASAATIWAPTDVNVEGDVNVIQVDEFLTLDGGSLALFEDTDTLVGGNPLVLGSGGGQFFFTANPNGTFTVEALVNNISQGSIVMNGMEFKLAVDWGNGNGYVGDFAFSQNATDPTAFVLSFNDGVKEGSSLVIDIMVVPLPAAAWLFGSALLGLVAVKRRKL